MRGEEPQRPCETHLEQGQRVCQVGGGAAGAVEQGRQRGGEEGEAAWRRQRGAEQGGCQAGEVGHCGGRGRGLGGGGLRFCRRGERLRAAQVTLEQ